MRGLRALVAASALAVAGVAVAAPVETFKPSALDPAVKAFDGDNVVITPPGAGAATPLALFLSGTGGPKGGPEPFLQVVAGQGYRVIGLMYDNTPAVSEVCPRDPDPACAADFRQMRLYGTGASKTVSNAAAESIAHRLVVQLRKLDSAHPGQGWAGYLDGDMPRWNRIVVSGLSQGAGMAAFVAKAHEVPRVVLFSSPWDFTGPQRAPAPWLSQPSATPPDRWWAEYNAREKTVPAIQRAYAALKIPPDHVKVFDLDLPSGAPPNGPNPYHPVTIKDPRYAPQWREMYGRAEP